MLSGTAAVTATSTTARPEIRFVVCELKCVRKQLHTQPFIIVPRSYERSHSQLAHNPGCITNGSV